MTLVMALINSDQCIQISDRRLSSNGKLISDEQNKAGIMHCDNARLIYGFSGLAYYKGHITQNWILDNLNESAVNDFQAIEILRKFGKNASKYFQTEKVLKKISIKDKALSILFSGYLYHHNPPKQCYAIITNQKLSGVPCEDYDLFKGYYFIEKNEPEKNVTAIERIGWPLGMKEAHIGALRALLEKKAPAEGLVGKAVEVMHEIADDPVSKGTIGKQLNVVVMHRDASKPVNSQYVSKKCSFVQYSHDLALLHKNGNTLLKDFKIESVDIDAPPLVVPKVGRNVPCPCGSGKKYKRCHGK